MTTNKEKTVGGIKLWGNEFSLVPELKPLCRKIAAEGSVLLKNDGVLPFKKGTKVALFGRNQEGYIKSGTGSGGLVQVEKIPVIWDSFEENGVFQIDEDLVKIYKEWIADNPYDNGHGWATEPWVQKEMPVDISLAKRFSEKNDVALIIIGRTAGESKDNCDTFGSYKLSSEEKDLIKNVSSAFKKTVIALNVGNLIDLSFMDENPISALLYVWQGGEEGANALADILSGKISPSGKLPDTQIYNITEYPALHDFGNEKTLVYKEDIYVGYRYFETFEPENVRYPFGFGITYTDFETECKAVVSDKEITVTATVKNIGNFTSKEVIQVYYGAPCGKLGNPIKQLAGFDKTRDLQPGGSQTLTITFPKTQMASFDDSGVTGNKNCYVMEAGTYKIYAGTDVRSAEEIANFTLSETVVTEKLEEIMPPETPFKRIVAKEEAGKRIKATEDTPLRETDLDERIAHRREKEIPFTGDKGIKLIDVAEGRNTLDEFVAQLSDKDLANIVCGEGMNSPKVTPGTGAAFGGVTDSLLDFGIPVCCVTDGPSGLRLGTGMKSTSLPNGYVFASSFDTALTEEIFRLEGVKLFRYNIDALLGPGMNIHRHPLCGRNFEYFSEDPLLSGKIAAAQSRGMAVSGCSTTIKHFCGNNQELARNDTNDIVSQRALREIYLKGFEIAVKESDVKAIMTSYNSVNGYHSASNYDLTTTVLRGEWGYKGFVMTDWWAKCNCKDEAGNRDNLKALVRSQNDVYMVCESAESKPHNILEGLNEGYIVRSDLQRSAKNLLRYIMTSPTFAKFVDGGCVKPDFGNIEDENMETVCVFEDIKSGDSLSAVFGGDNVYVFELCSNGNSLSQSSVDLRIDDSKTISLSVKGTEGKYITVKRRLKLNEGNHNLSFTFPSIVKIKRFTIKQ